MFKTIAFSIAAAALVGTAASARTSPDAGVRTLSVSYADLDLSSQAGQQALNRRIASAASRVCSVGGTRDLGQLSKAAQCKRDAISATTTRIAALRETRVVASR